MAYIGKSPSTGIRNRFIYTATAGQTTFSGTDDHNRTLSYTDAEFTDVFLNGVKLDKSDYTATSGTSIVLDEAATAGDTLEVLNFDTFSVFSGEFSQDVTVGGATTLSGDLTVDTNTLKVDSTNNRVGIGTTPASKLHVQTASSGATVGGGGDELILENSLTAGLSILSGASNDGNILFGDSGNSAAGYVQYKHGDDALAFGTVASERMRIDSSGRVLVGKTSTSFPSNGVELGTSVDANGWALWATGTPTSNGGVIAVNRKSSDGIFINVYKDSTNVGSIGTSGDLLYMASTSGAGFRLVNDDLRPATSTGANRDNALDLGHSNVRWDDVYATNGTIQTSDQNEKQQIASLTDAEITAAKAISKLFKTFKWNDKVEAKGDAARTHTGVIAQDVQQAMTDAGLDAGDYAFFISSTWWESGGETYDTQADAPDGATERTRLGIRYPELLAFVGAATEQRIADLETAKADFETRIAALEAN